MTLAQGNSGFDYTIIDIHTEDDELNSFLFTLGCYSGENISLVSQTSDTFVVSIRDARYSIDKHLAEAIEVATAIAS